MTTPTPALTALLDELDRLRAAATPGPWATDEAHGRDYCLAHENAALIVAAVDAAPALVAAVRNVLARIENLEISAPDSPYRTVAALLRSDLYAALEATDD